MRLACAKGQLGYRAAILAPETALKPRSGQRISSSQRGRSSELVALMRAWSAYDLHVLTI